jgi:hypothetical protein
MLEQANLWLSSWSTDTDRPAACTISDPATHQLLGQARRRPLPRSFWRRWLARPTLEVVETEDESLLCTIQRLVGFRPAWEVCDADGRYVGGVRGPHVVDPFGQVVCQRVGKNFVTLQGQELAALRPEEKGTLLSFGAELADNPFARMLLLAAALRQEE